MKTLVFLILVSSISSAFACRTDRMVYSRTTQYGISFGGNGGGVGFGQSYLAEIPVRYGNKVGCWQQKGNFEAELEWNEKGRIKGEVILYPSISKFKKVPGRTTTYLMVNDNSSDSRSIQIEALNFTCLGETVLSIQGYKGSVQDLAQTQDYSFKSSMNLRTGSLLAAFETQVQINDGKISTAGGQSDGLIPEFMARAGDNLQVLKKEDISTPKILASTNVQGPGFSYQSGFTTLTLLGGTQYGCSEQFEQLMSEYNIKNWNQKLNSEKVSTKYKTWGRDRFILKLK